jgi:uncharacterized protein
MANKLIEPVLNNAACEEILRNTYIGTLVMCQESTPYAVPMNHAFVGGRFYFHCGLRGRKIDMIKKNPNVVYVISTFHGTNEEMQTKERCHGPWESIVAYGTARVIEDVDAKAEAFKTFMSYYGTVDFQMTDQARNETSGIVIDIASMTARVEMSGKSGTKEYWLWLPETTTPG